MILVLAVVPLKTVLQGANVLSILAELVRYFWQLQLHRALIQE